jgi:preprotein translocase subunit Sec61beta
MSTTAPKQTALSLAPVVSTDPVLLTRRIVVGLSLAVIAAIHVLDLPGKFAETPYLAVAYLGLIVAALVIAERLFAAGDRRTRLEFTAAAVLSALVIMGFVVNRTVGMPGAMDDIGNWLEPLGLLSLLVEGFVIWQALAALTTRGRNPRR